MFGAPQAPAATSVALAVRRNGGGGRSAVASGWRWIDARASPARTGARAEARDLEPRWGLSSAGRAVALQASGRRFDPDRLHHSRVPDVSTGFASPFARGVRMFEIVKRQHIRPVKRPSLHEPATAAAVRAGYAWQAKHAVGSDEPTAGLSDDPWRRPSGHGS